MQNVNFFLPLCFKKNVNPLQCHTGFSSCFASCNHIGLFLSQGCNIRTVSCNFYIIVPVMQKMLVLFGFRPKLILQFLAKGTSWLLLYIIISHDLILIGSCFVF